MKYEDSHANIAKSPLSFQKTCVCEETQKWNGNVKKNTQIVKIQYQRKVVEGDLQPWAKCRDFAPMCPSSIRKGRQSLRR